MVGAAALMGVSITACASRSLPTAFPKGSAASPLTQEAQAAQVGVILAEDPPLPGESTARWSGLDDPASGSAAPGDAPAAPTRHHHHGAPTQSTPDNASQKGGHDGGHAH